MEEIDIDISDFDNDSRHLNIVDESVNMHKCGGSASDIFYFLDLVMLEDKWPVIKRICLKSGPKNG